LSHETIAATGVPSAVSSAAKAGNASRVKKWIDVNSTTKVTLYFAVLFLVLCLLGMVGYYFVQDATRWGKFPPGAKVSGVNVSGLSQSDAFQKVKQELAGVEQKPVILTLGDQQFGITPQELGLRLDYSQMVDKAYSQAWAPNIFERMFRSYTNRPKNVNGLLVIENNPASVDAFIKNVTAMANQQPRNAYVDVTSGKPTVVKARDGYQVAEATIAGEVGEALNSKSRIVAIKASRTPAALTDAIYNKLIVVNLAEHSLTLYNRDAPLASFGICCGQPAWPTPVGQWQIVGKQMNPTWYNPHSAWSASMPATIGPGYSNPLGVRAMPLNASGVLIHGTSNDGSIGTSQSHGCMRMHMPDVIKLFDMVEVGTPVYIISAAGNPGFDVTQTPSWRKAPGTPAANTYTGD
jgi:lipoprotein-anchoring transpeptidase ErfK/SrfK